MKNPETLMLEAKANGLRLEPQSGGKLAVLYDGELSPEFESVLRENKTLLLQFISDGHLITQVLFRGEYDIRPSRVMIENIVIRLSASRHPLAPRALDRALEILFSIMSEPKGKLCLDLD
jgi:hypothetical protein